MAEELVNKIINEEIDVKRARKWLLNYTLEVQDTHFSKCTQTDFLYYYLNCIHREILRLDNTTDLLKKNRNAGEKGNEKKQTKAKTHTNGNLINTSKEKFKIQPLGVKHSSSDDIISQPISPSPNRTNDSQGSGSLPEFNRSCSYQGSSDTFADCSAANTSSLHFSTPKLMKIQSDSSIDSFNNSQINSSNMSPISPFYKSNNVMSTPKNKRQHVEKTCDTKTPLCLGDFIVTKKSSNKKKNNRSDRSNNSSSSFKDNQKVVMIEEDTKRENKTANSFKFKENQKEIEHDYRLSNTFNFKDSEHDNQSTNSFNIKENQNNTQFTSLEKDKCKKQSTNSFNFKENQNGTGFTSLMEDKCKKLLRRNFSDTSLMKQEMEPSIELVTFKDALNTLANLYVTILDNDLVPNKISEIYFLISLLIYHHNIQPSKANDAGIELLDPTSNSKGSSKLKFNSLFKTVHNIVYFACQVLKTQIQVLRSFDKHTLKLLTNNRRLKAFVPGFVQALNVAINYIGERIEMIDDDSQMVVCFKSDTDNRENFPNDPTFHAFRKQRDLFYEILHTWTSKHTLPGWKFDTGLSGKIRLLFSLHNDPVNFMHFARLFTAQLLKSESKQVHSTLPNVDSDKLNKLINRMTENSSVDSSNTLNALPSFNGDQEFYRDFIMTAANYVFNKHLYDSISSQILHLNDSNFLGMEHSQRESDVEPSTMKSYTTCIKSLRVLAKFLGYIEATPYTSESNNYTETCLESHISVRQQTTPNFNIKSILTQAVQTEKLILTIPWLTEYLAMLDYVTLRLPYYMELIDILIGIYRSFHPRIIPQPKTPPYNFSLMKFCLGWLFELPHFPHGQYYSFIAKQKMILQDSNTSSEDSNTSCEVKKDDTDVNEKCSPLDVIEIVDLNVIYTCCPYLEEIRKLLSSNIIASSSSSSTPMRHMNIITISTMESQLKEAFFSGQPNSVRKTVEFVSDRVTSSCVKHLCHYVVPDFKKDTLKKFKILVSSSKGDDLEKEKNELKSKSFQIATDALRELHKLCKEETSRITKERIPISIGALLPVDVLEAVTDTCVDITRQMCLDRVNQWINTQVTTALFIKDMDTEIGRSSLDDSKKQEKPVFLLPPGGRNIKHNPDTTSAAHILMKIGEAQIEVLEKSPAINEDFVMYLLNETKKTLTERVDVNECIAASICSSLVDFSLVLIAHNFNLINEKVLLLFVDIWKLYFSESEELFKSLLCSRTVIMFSQSRDVRKAWAIFAMFVAFLIKHKILSCDNFESQCIAMFQRVWDQVTLDSITQFFNDFMTCYKKNGGSSSKFTFIIDFLADYCVDLDF